MNAVVESVRSLWLPLEGINLMLPNVAVAEVINYQPLDMVENGPHWLLGVVRWRERELPVIALEGICGFGLPRQEESPRLSVLNSVLPDSDLPFYVMVTTGIPRLVIADEEALGESVLAGKQFPETVADVVTIGSENALIPNLEAIQLLVEKAWRDCR